MNDSTDKYLVLSDKTGDFVELGTIGRRWLGQGMTEKVTRSQ